MCGTTYLSVVLKKIKTKQYHSSTNGNGLGWLSLKFLWKWTFYVKEIVHIPYAV